MSVSLCSYQLSATFEGWAPSTPEAIQMVGPWLGFHRLGVPGLPEASLQVMGCVCVGHAGQGSQRPGTEQVF